MQNPKEKIILPIDTESIEDFAEWIIWNKFSRYHRGFDFAAYFNKKKKIVFGLPQKTKIRAIDDGIVTEIIDVEGTEGYGNYIEISHKNGIVSVYGHVFPFVGHNQHVKKGELIGFLYEDPEEREEKRLVHLHFSLLKEEGKKCFYSDPIEFFDEKFKFYAEPQGNKIFMLKSFERKDFNILFFSPSERQ